MYINTEIRTGQDQSVINYNRMSEYWLWGSLRLEGEDVRVMVVVSGRYKYIVVIKCIGMYSKRSGLWSRSMNEVGDDNDEQKQERILLTFTLLSIVL